MSKAETSIEETQRIQNFVIRNFNEYNDDYSDLFYSFTEYILDRAKDYDIVILTTRRCFNLVCCVFENDFVKNEESIALWKKIISSQAINIKAKELSDKKVLLVDDIMIHGKAVFSLYRKLRNYNVRNIDTFVLARNIELPDFYKIVVGNYKYMYRLSQEKWLDLSNKIVDYFTLRHSVYVSYIYALKGKTFDFINKNLKLETIDCSDKSFKLFEQLSGFREKDTEIKTLKINSAYVKNNIYFREYSFASNDYKKEEAITVPFCFLETFTTDSLVNSWKSLLNIFKIECLKERITDSLDIYKCYTLIICYLLIDDLKNAKIAKEIEKSYYEGFFSDLLDLIYEIKKSGCDNYNKLDQLFGKIGLKAIKNVNFELLNNYSFDDKKFFNNLDFKDYILRITENEDKIFKKNLKAYYNSRDYLISLYNKNSEYIPLDLLYENYDGCDIDKFNAFLILLADSGSISFNTVKKMIDNTEYVTTALKTGEQSYRLFHAGSSNNAFIIANKFYDLYVLFYGNSQFNETVVEDYINYLEDKTNDRDLISEVKKILYKIASGEIANVLTKYNVLVNSKINENKPDFLKLIYNYFE